MLYTFPPNVKYEYRLQKHTFLNLNFKFNKVLEHLIQVYTFTLFHSVKQKDPIKPEKRSKNYFGIFAVQSV